MSSTFHGLEIAKSGLFASRSQLNITGHNIANAETIGYTRQRLATVALPPTYANGLLQEDTRALAGRGVESLKVEQIRDPFLDRQYRQLNTHLGYSAVRESEFFRIESIFNAEIESSDTGNGMSTVFSNFYRGIYRLTEDASSMEIRRSFLESALTLTETFNHYYNRLAEQQQNLNGSVETTVMSINIMAEEIADLNEQIFAVELSGSRANDLRDRRNILLDELSGKVNIDYGENPNGTLYVNLGGKRLVDHTDFETLSVVATKDNEAAIPGSGFLNEVYWTSSAPKADVSQLEALLGLSSVHFVHASSSGFAADQTLSFGQTLGTLTLNGVDASTYGFTSGSFADGGTYRIEFDLGGGNKQTLEFTVEKGAFADDAAIMSALSPLDIDVDAGFPGQKANITGGELMGCLDVRDGGTTDRVGIVKIIDDLNTLVRKIASEFNEQHRAGYTLHDNGASKTNIDFFDELGDISKLNAGNFSVAAHIISDVLNIAASDAPVSQPGETNNQKGNHKNALALSELITGKGDRGNFDGAYKGIVVGVGTQMDRLTRSNSANQTRMLQLEQQRESISGVSIDEEMTNVIRFQHAYNAASRFITTLDEQLDQVINRMGLVGRS